MPASPPLSSSNDLSPLAREIKKRWPFAQPAEEAYLNLVRTESALTGSTERLFKRFGLSGPKYNVLRILRGAAATGEAGPSGLPSLEVAARLITRVPDITRLVDNLETAGLVARTRCTDDRRVVYVGITPAGTALLAQIDAPLAQHHRKCFDQLLPPELAELNRLLVKLRRCREEDAADPPSDG
jgi:DNA-binding MarR family transcriptional regulator